MSLTLAPRVLLSEAQASAIRAAFFSPDATSLGSIPPKSNSGLEYRVP